MAELLQIAFKISLLLFMVGHLLAMGLRLDVPKALAGLRNIRFVGLSVLWGFVLCPALAYLLTMTVPLDPVYAMGLILLGMAPGAPFLPKAVKWARGNLEYAAAFMLLTSVVTVAYMPLAVPLMVHGLSASAWTIAKPLLYYVLLPLAIGIAIRRFSASATATLNPFVAKLNGVNLIAFLALSAAVYWKEYIGAIGTHAIGAQLLFFAIATVASYLLTFALPQDQRSVLVLGICTRNIGPAMAPLFSIPGVDQRAIGMVALGIPMQALFSILASKWLARRSCANSPASSAPKGDRTCQPKQQRSGVGS